MTRGSKQKRNITAPVYFFSWFFIVNESPRFPSTNRMNEANAKNLTRRDKNWKLTARKAIFKGFREHTNVPRPVNLYLHEIYSFSGCNTGLVNL